MTTDEEDRQFAAALDEAERMLGFRLERFLGATETEPANAADFKRLATVQAFGAAWPRTEHMDTRTRALISVTIAATLGVLEPLRGQLRIALNNGVTREEVVEAFIQISAYAGAARAFESYGTANSAERWHDRSLREHPSVVGPTVTRANPRSDEGTSDGPIVRPSKRGSEREVRSGKYVPTRVNLRMSRLYDQRMGIDVSSHVDGPGENPVGGSVDVRPIGCPASPL